MTRMLAREHADDNIMLDPLLLGIFFLPDDAEEMISLGLANDGVNFSRLLYRDRNWLGRVGGTRYTLQGNLPFYSRLENLAWPYIAPGQITFTTYDSHLSLSLSKAKTETITRSLKPSS